MLLTLLDKKDAACIENKSLAPEEPQSMEISR